MNSVIAIQRLIEVCRRQHKSLSTERVYALWLKQYVQFIQKLPEMPSEEKVGRFLTMLAQKRDVSASTQNQCFSALLFFYKNVLCHPLKDINGLRATRPDRIRYCPSREEVLKLLPLVRNIGGYPTSLVTRLLYGCGLRVGEPLALRIKDVDLANSKLAILGAKGKKDRVVRLPCSLIVEMQQQMDYARAIWKRDQVAKIPVVLPHQLAKKYPAYQFSWSWAWLFPMHHPCKHPRTQQMVRWHLLSCNVQRAVREASQKLGLTITPHADTTLSYCHADALSVKSPLDA